MRAPGYPGATCRLPVGEARFGDIGRPSRPWLEPAQRLDSGSDGQLVFFVARSYRNDPQCALTLTLKHLVEDGLVARTAYAEVPPRVEYKVTELGRTLGATGDGTGRVGDGQPRTDQRQLQIPRFRATLGEDGRYLGAVD